MIFQYYPKNHCLSIAKDLMKHTVRLKYENQNKKFARNLLYQQKN